MPDQCLYGLSLHQDVLQAHSVIKGRLRQGSRAMAGTRVERNAARGLGVRGGDLRGPGDLVGLAAAHRYRVGWMPSAFAMVAICARWRSIEAANSFAPPRLGVCAVALRVSSMSLSSETLTTSAPIRSRNSAGSALLPNRPTSPSMSRSVPL